jgi:hypothetical protein
MRLGQRVPERHNQGKPVMDPRMSERTPALPIGKRKEKRKVRLCMCEKEERLKKQESDHGGMSKSDFEVILRLMRLFCF